MPARIICLGERANVARTSDGFGVPSDTPVSIPKA